MWIFGNLKRELLFLYLPGLVGVLIACLDGKIGETSLLYGLLVTAVLDSGHVYTTFWRTHLHTDERKSSHAYWIAPLVIFSGFATWYALNLPYLWSFVVYASFYHHQRQAYGFSKWYQYLNKSYRKTSDVFLYVLSWLTLLAYHFRSGVMSDYYGDNALIMYPDENIFRIVTGIFLAVFASWIVYELILWKKGFREYNRIMSVASPVLVYSYCFFIGKTFTEVIFPFTILHAVSYFGIMGQSLERTQKARFSSFQIALGIVLGTALVFGIMEAAVEEYVIGTTNFESIVVGLYLTPLFLHYYFDSVIWRKNHREARAFLEVPVPNDRPGLK